MYYKRVHNVCHTAHLLFNYMSKLKNLLFYDDSSFNIIKQKMLANISNYCYQLAKLLLCFPVISLKYYKSKNLDNWEVSTIANVALLSVSSRSEAASKLACSKSRRFFFIFSLCMSAARSVYVACGRRWFWTRIYLFHTNWIVRWTICIFSTIYSWVKCSDF